MAVTHSFESITVSGNSAPLTITQYNMILGSAAQDSLTLATEFSEIKNVAMNNGNLQWTESNGSITALSSEIDFIVTDLYNYINLNTQRSAVLDGVVMSQRTRAIVSDEWLDDFANGTITIDYRNTLGEDALDTIISGTSGTVTLADYSLKDNITSVTTIGFYVGGAVIDFGVGAVAAAPELSSGV